MKRERLVLRDHTRNQLLSAGRLRESGAVKPENHLSGEFAKRTDEISQNLASTRRQLVTCNVYFSIYLSSWSLLETTARRIQLEGSSNYSSAEGDEGAREHRPAS